MKLHDYKLIIFVILIVILCNFEVFAAQDRGLYYQAKRFAREGKRDFAFMYFNRIVRNYPESKFFKNSIFAVGEYYYKISNYLAAVDAFYKFIEKESRQKGCLFAYIYLLKLAEKAKKIEISELLRKKIISLKKVSLLFRDFEEIRYLSPLYNRYKAVFFIDKIKFYINEKLFEEISY